MVRRAVLDAASELFSEKGFNGTSLQNVADALKISRAGLYYHFPTKEKILEALVEEVTMTGLRDYSAAVKDAEKEPTRALRTLIHNRALWVLVHGRMFRLLDHSENELPGDLRRRHDEGKRAMIESLASVVELGVNIGQFRPIDPMLAAFAMMGMCTWTAWWFKPNGRLTEEVVATTLADFAVRTVLRSDAHRSRSERIEDIFRILKEDIGHLENVLTDQ